MSSPPTHADREDVLAARPEERLARIVALLRRQAARVLEVEPARLPAERSLIAVGLDSLAAAELAGAIESGLGVQVPFAYLLEGPSLAELGEQIVQLLAAPAPAATVPPACATLPAAITPPASIAQPASTTPPADDAAARRYPLSHGQRALWLLDRLVPGGNPAYILAGAARVHGDLDGPRLRRALQALVERHAALRTVFEEDGEDVVQVVREAPVFTFADEDARAWSEKRLRERLSEATQRPFDLAEGPLLRVTLLRRQRGRSLRGGAADTAEAVDPERVADAADVVALAVHHIVADFRSLEVLLDELGALYRGESLPPPGWRYGDFVRWQAERLAGAEGSRLGSYWRAVLPPGAPPLALPTDRPRPPLQTFGGGSRSLRLDRDLSARLQALGRRAAVTPFMTLLAAFLVLLHRYSGQDDLLVGTPASGRTTPELAGVVGYCVNPVVVRGDLAGDPSFGELLGRVRETAIAALAHQDYPFPLLAESLAGERDPSRSPIFQAMFVLYLERRDRARGLGGVALGEGGVGFEIGGVAMESVRLARRSSQLDLTLLMAGSGGALLAALEFNGDLFDAATAERLLAQLHTLAAGIAGAGGARRKIGELPLLGAAERQQLLEWNATAAPYPRGRCLHQLIEEQVRRTPAAPAVEVDGGESLTFHELNARANRLARRLRRLGVGPETVVALCAERSAVMVVGLVAILKAGGAYLPLDPDYPQDRLRFMLRDSRAAVLLAQSALLPRLGLDEAAACTTLSLDDSPPSPAPALAAVRGRPSSRNLESGVQPGNLAYVIYTSGSTGKPKGTMNSHGGIVNRLLWMQAQYRLAADDRVLQKTPFSFDVSVWELFWPLLAGARLVMARPGGHRDGAYLLRTLAARQITTVHFVPSMLRAFLEVGSVGSPLGETDTSLRSPLGETDRALRSPLGANTTLRREVGSGGSLDAGRLPLPLLRRVFASGEALPYDLQQQFGALLGAPLHNLYGPTEAAVDVTYWACEPGAGPRPIVPIGRPVANTAIHLLDRHRREVPIGVPGDLYIGGVQLARGYLGRPGLTAERFVPSPYGEPGARLYRTGDVARWLPDGAIEFLGRSDDQVKLRGFRIELGEIEAALAQHPAVLAAAVAVRSAAPAAGDAGAAGGAGGGAVAGDLRLVAYVVPRSPATPDLDDLRRMLAETLPDYMVPADFAVLDRLPLTPSGKLDRKALPAPALRRQARGAAGDGGAAPRGPVEELLAGMWIELLGVPAVGPGDNFFELGGHSLTATRLVSRLRRALGVELPLRRVFERPTLAALAGEVGALIGQAGPQGPGTSPAGPPSPGPPQPGPPQPASQQPGPPQLRHVPAGRAAAAPADQDLVLSYAQERIWFLERLARGSAAYNLPGALWLRGKLDRGALAGSLNEIVRRHEVLRSAFPAAAGKPSVTVSPHRWLDVPLVDLAALGKAAATAAGPRLGSTIGRQPFDLAAGPLLRAALLRLGEEEHLLVLVLHHIVADGWSLAVLLGELAALYAAFGAGRPSPLAEPPLQYSDFARWQRGWLVDEVLATHLAYWRQALAGAPAHLELPADRPRPAVQSFRGARTAVLVQPALAAELRRIARQSGATLFMTLLGAFAVLLSRLTGQQDLVIGSPIANRERLELEGLIGCFVNTLALRVDLSGRPSFRELLRRVTQVSLVAYAHQDLPFEKLVEALAPQRDLGTTPVFQVLLVLQNTGSGRLAEATAARPRPGAAAAPAARANPATAPSPATAPAPAAAALVMEPCELEITAAKFDLTLDVSETSGGLAMAFEHRLDLFDVATVKRLAQQFRTLLAALAGGAGDAQRGVDEISLLGAAARQQLLLEWNDAPAAVRSRPAAPAAGRLSAGAVGIHQLFEWQAARRPEATAVCWQGAALTYGELETRSNRLARYLRRRGVGPEVRVGLCVERSPEMVVALLGILKAGGAYVPLDPGHPAERLALVLGDSSMTVLVTEQRWLERLDAAGHSARPRLVCLDRDAAAIAAEAGSPPGGAALAESLAYVLYTSGSTGRPKGVGLPHRAVVNLLRAVAERPGLGAGDVMPALATLTFDIAGVEIYLPLAVGGRVEVVGREEGATGRRLAARLAAAGVTAMQATPATWRLLLDTGWQGLPGLKAVCTGEALPRDLAVALPERGLALWNMYGPTETAVYSSGGPVAPGLSPDAAISLGQPIANTRLYVVDRSFEPVPPGVAGELLIGGEGLARGYWGRPDLTAASFVPDPLADGEDGGARLYRTGDLVRRRPNGDLELLGRIDHQVKLRGFRIELGEIEAALLRHPVVDQAVVAALGEGVEKRLVAYLVRRPQGSVGLAKGRADRTTRQAAAAASAGPEPAELRAFLRQTLPDYMVPAAFVFLDRLPLTPSGKLDRRALPAPAATPGRELTLVGGSEPALAEGSVGSEPAVPGDRQPAVAGSLEQGAGHAARIAPRTPAEELLAGLWAEVLGVERVGRDDNFFDLGGHSLLLARLHARLEDHLGKEFPLLDLFLHPTVRAQAEHLLRLRQPAPPPAPAAGPVSHQPTGARQEGIAIVGMAGRFPGARDVEELWRNLRDGVDCIYRFGDEELLAEGLDPDLLGNPRYVKAGGVVDGEELFDAAFFDYAPREAELLDPQHRLFLECAHQALEAAGHDPERFRGAIGVYAGAGHPSYFLRNVASNPELLATVGERQASLGNSLDYLATRVSYKLDLRGPSVDVQTACSSSLVAVHFACQGLLAGDCDLALAGGAEVRVPQRTGYLHEEGGIESAGGVCRAFDAAADGTVWGNGAGVVALMRLADALAGGHAIHAVILGTAINNDGAGKVGFTAPSVAGQTAVIAAALARSGCAPETIRYVECHGTGTPLGDPIEVRALADAFGPAPRRGSCALGSVKTNLGHLGAAAGVTGLIKAALALDRREIPPSLHFTQPNPKIDFAASPFFVNPGLAEWRAEEGLPRRAGVSSFGIGGTNAHAVLEEAPAAAPSGPSRPWQLLLLSAKSEAALEAATDGLASWLAAARRADLADVAHTLQVGRRVLPWRRALVCRSGAEARQALAGRDARRLWTVRQEAARRPVVFLFPGQGAQHAGMGRGLYDSEPVFRRELDACARHLGPLLGRDLLQVISPADERRARAEAAGELDQTRLAQPALFAVEYALARLWMSWGVLPWAMLGHSLGEVVAACLAGVFSLADALSLVVARGAWMQAQPAGAMLSVELAERELAPLLLPPVELAAVNGPAACVASGPMAAMAELEARLRRRGVGCRRLQTSHAFHSAMMEPVVAPFAELLATMERSAPAIPYVSNLTGDWIAAGEATDPAYWGAHLRRTVRLGDGIERLLASGAEPIFLEVGPGRTLASLVRQGRRQPAGGAATASLPVAISSLRHPRDPEADGQVLLGALGRLWLAGAEIDWTGFSAGERRRRVVLPTYPFQRQRCWIEPGSSSPAGERLAPPDGQRERVVDLSEAVAADRRAAPRDATEARIVELFERLLGVRGVGIHDSFFELGGHSLLGTRLIALLAGELGIELPIRALFEAPTPAELAARARVHAAGGGGSAAVGGPAAVGGAAAGDGPSAGGDGSAAGGDGSAARADGSPAGAGAAAMGGLAPIERLRRDGEIPASFGQQRLWFLHQLLAGSALYNVPLAVSLRGALAVPVLAASLAEIARRHESLRTSFRLSAGEPVQAIAPAVDLPVAVVDLGSLPPPAARQQALRIARAESARSFDLQRAPLLRVALVRLASAGGLAVHPAAAAPSARLADEHLLLLTMSHVVSDGWSIGLLIRELGLLYAAFRAGRPSPLPDLPIQYADFAGWQRRRLAGDTLAGELAFWRRQLSGLPPLELPTDRPRPAAPSGRGAAYPLVLTPGLGPSFERLCREARVTPFMVLVAAFAALLGRHSGQSELAVGTTVAGRAHPQTAELIGFFVNTLVLRADLGGEPTAGELLARVRDTTLDAYAHQELPFEKLVAELQPDRDLSQTPLFQAMISHETTLAPPGIPGLDAAVLPAEVRSVRFDLTLALRQAGDQLLGRIEYRTDLFEPATIQRLGGQLSRLLAGIVAGADRRLSELPLLTAAARHQLLCEWNAAAWESGGDDLVQTPFERQAARRPAAVAVVAAEPGAPGEHTVTYGELEARAARLARRLRALGLGPERIAGICAEPSCAMVTGVLAILKAGGAYLPLDPALPPHRLAQVLAGSGARLVLAEERFAARLPAAVRIVPLDDRRSRRLEAAPAPPVAALPDNTAYVLYTSGSTGEPKGVAVSHRAVVNRLRFQVAADLATDSRVLQRTRLGFDVSVVEVLAPLWAGATVVLTEPARQQDAAYLARVVDRQQITNLNLPPALFPALLAEEAFCRCRSLRRVVTGGDRVPGDLPRRYFAAMTGSAPLLLSRYGPTEATVSVAEWRCESEPGGRQGSAAASVPLGRPLGGARFYVLDRAHREVPPGAAGELCIAGVCLARGYLARPDLTAAAFVPSPFAQRDEEAGGRLYRSGDLVRQRADGVLQFLGRIDRQVKIRGFRIELGEIEAVLAADAAVQAAAVVVSDAPRSGGDAPRFGGDAPPSGGDAPRSGGGDVRGPGGRRLVAYLVARGERPPEADDLRRALAARLPDYMVPADFVFLDRLPLTASGKLDQQALPAPTAGAGLGAEGAGRMAPRTPVELLLAGLWTEVLGLESVGVRDNFFALGGHSLLAVRLMALIRQRFGRELPLATLFRAATIERLAALLQAGSGPAGRFPLVELTPAGSGPRRRPFFCVHPAGGNVLCYADLAQALGSDQPFYGLQLPDLEALGPAPTIETLAARYLAALAAVAPAGPYALGGWSLGGAIAYEMARQLDAAGETVAPLVLIDPSPLTRCAAKSTAPAAEEALLKATFVHDLLALSGRGQAAPAEALRRLDLALPVRQLAAAAQATGLIPAELDAEDVARLYELFRTTRRALEHYRPAPYAGRLTLLLAARRPAATNGRPAVAPAAAWAALAGAGAELVSLPGDHYSIMRPPAVAGLARVLRRWLAATG